MDVAQKMAVVVLPGMDGTGELLTAFVNQLSVHRPVQLIAYPRDSSLGYQSLTDFVKDRAPKERFVVLGESFSGPIAIEVAATEKRVAGLVLVSSFVRQPMPSFLRPFAAMLDLNWIPSRLVLAALLGPAEAPELKIRLAQVLASLPRDIVRARMSEVLRVDKRDALRAIECPLSCLQGRRDWLVRKRHLNEIRSTQPGCEVRWFDASHMLLATHTDAAVAAINAFCDRSA